MSDITETQLEAQAELRAKYDADTLQKMGEKDEAFKNPDGHYSFPIADSDDLKKAIHALGRSGASHDAVKAYIVKRAKALGLTSMLPEEWQKNSASGNDECPMCEGSGEVDDKTCPQCEGSGKLNPERSNDAEYEWRKRKVAMMQLGRVPEKRIYPSEIEIRETSDDQWTLTGYASVTDVPYDIGGMYVERVAKGAFRRNLKSEPDVVLNINHGGAASGLPIARTKAGTLSLSEDRHGLFVEAFLDPLDPDVQLLHRKMKRGDLDGQMSFAFKADDQTWSDDYSERTLNAVTINGGDVSVVVQGANPHTSSQFRALENITEQSLEGMVTEFRSGSTPSDETRAILGALASLVEERSGRVLSSANVEGLKEVLRKAAVADEQVDDIQPLLARILQVANPDKDADDKNSESDGEPTPPIASSATDGRSALISDSPLPNATIRARQRLEALERRAA